MRMTNENFGSNLRLALAIAATTGVMICLWLVMHSCTPQTLDDDRPTGTGIALQLGDISMKSGGKAQTKASSAITTMSGWEFANGDLLNVSVQATDGSTQTSIGTYSYYSNRWYTSTVAYWQSGTQNTVRILWGPTTDDSKVYQLPGSYDVVPSTDEEKGKMWNGTKCTSLTSLWRYCDLLHYQASGIPAQSTAFSAELSHCMAQLCVELTAGQDMTQSDVEKATVSILGAYGCYTIDATLQQPVACQADDANATDSPTTKDITLLKNGYTSLKHYALLLPGQVFSSTARMIKISIGNDIYYYTPNGDVKPATGSCLNLKLQVDKTAVSAVNVSSTGWDNEVTTGGTPQTDDEVIVINNATAGSLTLPANPATNAKVMITGVINETDLETLKANMGKFSELYINATLSETTALPDRFATGKNNLKVITLPEGITSIGGEAFRECTGLTSISLPEKLTSIGYMAFRDCTALTSISLPEEVTSIEGSAFYRCSSLASINLPEALMSTGESVFGYCTALTNINLPKKWTSIGNYIFKACTSLTSINLPEGITSIGRSAFSECRSLTNINLPEGITNIGESAFSYCTALASINLPEKLTSIGDQAFSSCTALISISLPEKLTSIGDEAFSSCTSLRKVVLNGNIPFYFTTAFTTSPCSLFLPKISAEDFAADPNAYINWRRPYANPWSAVYYDYSPAAGTTPTDYANPDNYLGHWP